jgi:protein-tyrosine phosphatase
MRYPAKLKPQRLAEKLQLRRLVHSKKAIAATSTLAITSAALTGGGVAMAANPDLIPEPLQKVHSAWERTERIAGQNKHAAWYLAKRSDEMAVRFYNYKRDGLGWIESLGNAYGPEIPEARERGLENPVPPEFYKAAAGVYSGTRIFNNRATDDLFGRLVRYDDLRALGIKGIVNLQKEDKLHLDANQRDFVVKYIEVPDNTPPTTAEIIEFLNFATDPANRPLYVHCDAGKGRSRTMVTMYLIVVEGKDAQTVLDEFKAFTVEQRAHTEELVKRFLSDNEGKVLKRFHPKWLPDYAPAQAKAYL